ncbi:hypothetical protein [Staphylococcus saprophyticus]|uniref:hypothetical protein n=1 Tax=Staphylococcus saprophyticus TaxID=29385 RepID=UPI0017818B45|nr:hypothetical protein [Staphylococcus saprophyticus]
MMEDVGDNVKQCGIDEVVSIVGEGGDSVKERVGERWVYSFEEEELGRGDAVKMGSEDLSESEGRRLVVCGERGLIRRGRLK